MAWRRVQSLAAGPEWVRTPTARPRPRRRWLKGRISRLAFYATLRRMRITRRDFIERASCAAAILARATSTRAANSMFVSLNGAVTRGVSGADKIRLAAKVGYGGVDWDLGPAKAAGLDQTKALFSELRIIPTI